MTSVPTEDRVSTSFSDLKTQGEVAYWVLRQDILSGRLAPETKLLFRELRDRYQLGLPALREALAKLASERLVDFAPLRGYRVARLSMEELDDICTLRTELSVQGLADAIVNGDADWEADIVASLHRLVRTPVPDTEDFHAIEIWEKRHEAFHQTLIAACGSPWRLHLCAMLSLQFERYRRLILARMSESPVIAHAVEDDHRAIAAATVARAQKEATELLRAHLRQGVKFLAERSDL